MGREIWVSITPTNTKYSYYWFLLSSLLFSSILSAIWPGSRVIWDPISTPMQCMEDMARIALSWEWKRHRLSRALEIWFPTSWIWGLVGLKSGQLWSWCFPGVTQKLDLWSDVDVVSESSASVQKRDRHGLMCHPGCHVGDDLKLHTNQSCPPLPYEMKVKNISFRSKKKGCFSPYSF